MVEDPSTRGRICRSEIRRKGRRHDRCCRRKDDADSFCCVIPCGATLRGQVKVFFLCVLRGLAGAARMGVVRVFGFIMLARFLCSSSRFASAARLGEVRIEGCILYTRYGRYVLPDLCAYLVYADSARNIERIHVHPEQILRNWHIWWGRAGWPYLFMHEEQTENGEGAPVHSSAAPARRFGPTLAIKLSSRCDAARRRDTEWSDLCQLRQLQWRSARAGGIIYLEPRFLQVIVGSRFLFLVNPLLHFSVNSILRATHFL